MCGGDEQGHSNRRHSLRLKARKHTFSWAFAHPLRRLSPSCFVKLQSAEKYLLTSVDRQLLISVAFGSFILGLTSLGGGGWRLVCATIVCELGVSAFGRMDMVRDWSLAPFAATAGHASRLAAQLASREVARALRKGRRFAPSASARRHAQQPTTALDIADDSGRIGDDSEDVAASEPDIE
jgi:hypothetical protein